MHYSLLLITNGSIEEAMDPFWEGFELGEERSQESKYDFYKVGGRWYGVVEATTGEHGERSWTNKDKPDESGHYDIFKLCDVVNIHPELIHAVLTPDGEWHEREWFVPGEGMRWYEDGHWEEDERWDDEFDERFVKPYLDYTAYLIDYHS